MYKYTSSSVVPVLFKDSMPCLSLVHKFHVEMKKTYFSSRVISGRSDRPVSDPSFQSVSYHISIELTIGL